MNVKSVFLNGFIEEIFVKQPLANNETLSKEFSKLMQSEFKMSMMGELNYFLAFNSNKKTMVSISIKQKIYDGQSWLMSILLHLSIALIKDELDKHFDYTIYRGIIGSLLYLFASRLDIMHNSNPRDSHLTIVKRIFRYLVGTTNLTLFYEKSQDFKLVGFCDVRYVGDILERKSISRGCHFIMSYILSKQEAKFNNTLNYRS
ncbi:putative mitochondrial protein, partial [Mucuna pruriens]